MWSNSPAYKRMKRKLDFSKNGKYQQDRRIMGFYYTYVNPKEVGDRSQGWLMIARDRGLAKCAGCGAELIAPEDGHPYWCTACSHEEDQRQARR